MLDRQYARPQRISGKSTGGGIPESPPLNFATPWIGQSVERIGFLHQPAHPPTTIHAAPDTSARVQPDMLCAWYSSRRRSTKRVHHPASTGSRTLCFVWMGNAGSPEHRAPYSVPSKPRQPKCATPISRKGKGDASGLGHCAPYRLPSRPVSFWGGETPFVFLSTMKSAERSRLGADPLRRDKRDEFHTVVDTIWRVLPCARTPARSFKLRRSLSETLEAHERTRSRWCHAPPQKRPAISTTPSREGSLLPPLPP